MPRLTPPPNLNPRAPRVKLPPNAVDSHVHMFGPVDKYAFAPDATYVSEDATAKMYFDIQDRLGLAKVVLVSGGGYGQTYTHLADMLAQYPQRMRGVVRLPPNVTAAELAELDKLGVRGARFFGGRRLAAMTQEVVDMISTFGWHIQFYPEKDELPAIADRLLALDKVVVLDHYAHNSAAGGINSAGFKKLFAMLDTGRVWVKISGPMRITDEEPPYPSVTPIVRALIKHAPERLVWGSDWPHTNMWDRTMPNDGDLVDLVGEWMPDAATAKKILVDNPAKLYGF